MSLLGKILFCTAILFIGSCSVVRKPNTSEQKSSLPEQKPSFFVSNPIKFSSSNAPCVEIEIEERTFLMKLDLGFRGALVIMEETAVQIAQKDFVGEKRMYNIRGNEYLKKLYQIPEVKIGGMTFIRPIMQEETQDCRKESVFVQGEAEVIWEDSGVLGWELFENANLLIDVKNARIVFCDSLETLGRNGYAVDQFIKVPLLLERGLVEFETQGPHGPLLCTLDTGCTVNFLNREGKCSIDQEIWKPENIISYNSFKIGEIEVGPLVFRQIPLKLPIPLEAILGMEFFEDHLVFLDFGCKNVYFSK